MIRVLDIIEDTMVDGPGFRTSIYCAGIRAVMAVKVGQKPVLGKIRELGLFSALDGMEFDAENKVLQAVRPRI